jgi:glycosyltransferase involved in cell wall biosynthesis
VVIPVYNERETIAATVLEWAAELDRRALDYELLVYDDGSRDESARVLEDLGARVPRLILRRHANIGHGPTVLRGYRAARGDWILQADGDSEVAPASVGALWEAREGHDFVIGVRRQRRARLSRRLVTVGARLSVWLLFGAHISDVNAPFRLMSRTRLLPLLPMLPDDCFAPNVALAGLAARAGLRMGAVPVTHRSGRPSSLRGLRLGRAAGRAWWQTLGIARRARRDLGR